MPRFELHVGAEAFWRRAAQDVASARDRVLVQAMTFEGDRAGQAAAAAIAASTALDRRVLVDDYTRHVINDTFLMLSREPALRAEAAATAGMFDQLQATGAEVRVTNPVDANPLRYPVRNHKKLLVMDDVVWLGGINFSDHNFAWHDMMLRCEDVEVSAWMAARFDADWHGQENAAQVCFGDELQVLSLDGRGNAARFAPVLALFSGARHSVELISAYPTFPFIEALASAAARGVAVTIYTPQENNKPIVRNYLLRMASKRGLAVRLLPEMTHVKAAMIDNETLIAGSSNFDFVSYRASAEYVLVVRDGLLSRACETDLFAPARAVSLPASAGHRGRWSGLGAELGLRCADAILARLSPGPRIAEWRSPRSRLAEQGGHG